MATPGDGEFPPEDATSEASQLSFLYDLTTAPCFRQSALTALGGGAAIASLNMYRNRNPMRAAETMVKSGCGIALLSWVACRKRFYDEREVTYGAVERLRRQQAEAAAARARAMREGGSAAEQ